MKKLLFVLIFILWAANAFGQLVPVIEVDSIDFDGDSTKTTVAVGEEVYFSATGTTLNSTAFANSAQLGQSRYEWDFGDGYYHRWDPAVTSITRSSPAVVHYYMTPGVYTATLSVKTFHGFNSLGLPEPFFSAAYGTTIGMGTTKNLIAYGPFSYRIGGTRYDLTPDYVGISPGSDTVPTGRYGAVALDVGADMVVDVVSASANSTGYTSSALAIEGLPAVAAGHVRMGTATVVNWAPGGFTFGTTAFDAHANINVSFVPTVKTLWPIYPWAYNIGGTIYTLEKNTIGISLGNDVIPQGRYGAIALEVGTDKVIHIVSATGNATGYGTISAALAGLPAVAANHARMGTIVLNGPKSTTDFILGESSVVPTTTSEFRVTAVESTPVYHETTTATITVSGEAPIANFEIQRAPFNNRTKQYLYVQIPAAYRNNTHQLRVSLIGAISGTTVLLAPKSNLAAEEVALLDQTSLGIDKYTVRAEILNASGNRIPGGIWDDKFNKTIAGIPTIAIDENNSFVVNGTLFYPISAFMVDNSKMAAYATQGGLNSLSTEGYYLTHNPITYADYLSKAHALGLYVNGPGRGNYYPDYTGHIAQRWMFNIDPDKVTAYVEATKDDPAQFSWNWDDEPNMGGRQQKAYPPTLAAWSWKGHNIDPNHPFSNLFYGYDWLKYYGAAPNVYDYLASASLFGGKKWVQDLFGFDVYPLQYRLHTTLNYSDMGIYAASLDGLDRIHTNNRNLIPVTPARMPCKGRPEHLEELNPSEDQVFMEAWLDVIHGSKGMIWFPLFVADTIKWNAMKKFSDQMQVLQSVLLRGPSGRTVSDTANPLNTHSAEYIGNRVDTITRTSADGQYLYIVAARVTEPTPIAGQNYAGGNPCPTNDPVPATGCEPNELTVTFTISGEVLNATGVVYDEGRTVNISSNTFSDTFTANAVHIYQIPLGIEADTIAPVISSFSIPPTSSILTNSVTFTCSDETSDVLYCLSETNSMANCSWSINTLNSFTFSEAGSKTLYGFCKDYANNSTSASGNITITLTDNTAPTVTEFTMDDSINAPSLPSETDVTLSCTDNVEVTGYCLSNENTSINCLWQSSAPTTFSLNAYGLQTVYSYCRDAAGNEATDSKAIEVYPIYREVQVTAGNGCYLDNENTTEKTDLVVSGSTYSVPIIVEDGYSITGVSGCGGTWSTSPYVTGSITSNCSINVSCKKEGVIHAPGGLVVLDTLGDKGVINFGTPAPSSSCSSSTDYIGNKNTDGAARYSFGGTAFCHLFTPSCYGSVKSVYLNSLTNNGAISKVCLYQDDGDNVPSIGDSKISCSAPIIANSVGWVTAEMEPAILTNGNYFSCLFVDYDNQVQLVLNKGAMGSQLYYWTPFYASGWYDNPPSSFTNYSTVTSTPESIYITIGD